MRATVQARLDKQTQAILKGLVKNRGFKTSEVVRKGIHLVALEAEANQPLQIIGLGEYDSGISDLASNKKYLEGYGRQRRPPSVKVRKVSSR